MTHQNLTTIRCFALTLLCSPNEGLLDTILIHCVQQFFFQDFCSRSYNLYKSLDFDICGSLSKNAITSFTIIDRCGLPACCVPGCRRLLVLCIPSPGPETCNKASFKQIIYNQYASYELDHQYITQQYHQSKTNFMLVWQEHKPVLGRYRNLVQNQAGLFARNPTVISSCKNCRLKELTNVC
jgi:hypothetical protein